MILRMVRWKYPDGEDVKVVATDERGATLNLIDGAAIESAMKETGPDTQWYVGDWRSGAIGPELSREAWVQGWVEK